MSRFHNLEFNNESFHETPKESAVRKDEPYYLERAQTAFSKGRFEEALRAFSKALEFNPRSVSAWAGQVRMLIELAEFSEAKLWADKALEMFPKEPELLAAKAVALARLGDTKAALAFSDAAIEEKGNTPYIWLARADVLMARKEKRAEYCFEKALALASGNWFFLWLASRIQSYYRRFAAALRYAQQALAFNPAEAVLWGQIARCELALGLLGQAQMSLEQARELDPDFPSLAETMKEVSDVGALEKFKRRWAAFFRP
jgi:tetratricopeptide (TPR) repeat protein